MQKRTPRRDQDGLYERPDSPFYWVSYIDARGQRVRGSTGIRKSIAGRQEAEALLAKKRLETHRAKRWDEQPQYTFEDIMVQYLRAVETRRTAAKIKRHVMSLRQAFAAMPLEAITPAHITAYIETRREAGLAASSINRELEVLSAAVNHCRSQLGWGLRNPVERRSLPEPEGRVRWITRQEARCLIKAAQQSSASYLADLITLALHTDMRRGEMLGLEWTRVDLQQSLIHLEAEHTKAKKRHTVPLNATAKTALLARLRWRAAHCPGTPWVFCDQYGRRVDSVKRSFTTACRRAGIRNFRFHDLRHTCAAWLVTEGVPLSEVRDLLGHSSVVVTERYAHLAPHRVRAAVAVLDASRSSHANDKATLEGSPKSLNNWLPGTGSNRRPSG